jgi:hypothetical protein
VSCDLVSRSRRCKCCVYIMMHILFGEGEGLILSRYDLEGDFTHDTLNKSFKTPYPRLKPERSHQSWPHCIVDRELAALKPSG